MVMKFSTLFYSNAIILIRVYFRYPKLILVFLVTFQQICNSIYTIKAQIQVGNTPHRRVHVGLS